MSNADVERLRAIKTFPALVKYLRDELDWPITSEDVEDLTFDYTPEELGIDIKTSANIQEIKQLRPVSKNQPWGIFFLKFEPKKLPVTVLRRILSRLVVKKRQLATQASQPVWHLHDLLFISSYGEGQDRQITFAHFTQDEAKGDLPTLKVLGWDDRDTKLHMDHAVNSLRTHFRWPVDEADTKAWRKSWSSAFSYRHMEAINTAKDLAAQLAGLAMRIRSRVNQAFEVETSNGPIRKLHKAFQEALIHDLSEADFADMYAQTITYGLLAARVSRPMGIIAENLSEVIPVTNPFLKEMLETFLKVGGRDKGGIDFDELGVQEVVEVLNAPGTNIEVVLRNFNNEDQQKDPVIHFYEDFLAAYDNTQKKKRGVFYTPQPIVSYIVRSVHQHLQTDFGLEDGLASTVTWGELVLNHPELKIPQGISPGSPFIQILDPATGTGTFLVEIIDLIFETMQIKWNKLKLTKTEQLIAWNEYVPNHLLPRLYGFELMMAPYAIAHLKVGLKLFETGYTFLNTERIHIYLTDSLETFRNFTGQFKFAIPALAHEAIAVNTIKENTQFTVIVGNPPYLREKERGPEERETRIGGWVRYGDEKFGRAPIFDDFISPLGDVGLGLHAKLAYEMSVMFWRMALWMTLEKKECIGIIGMISPRAYISGPGHLGMRKFMREHADSIKITDLGGDNRGARKSENVFEIETGVTVGICVKGPKHKISDVDVTYMEILGSSEEKLQYLEKVNNPATQVWARCSSGSDVFLPSISGPFASWPLLTNIFPWQHSGVQYKRLWPISESKDVLKRRWKKLTTMPAGTRGAAFIETDARIVDSNPNRGSVARFTGIKNLNNTAPLPSIKGYCYRAFDRQWAFIDPRFADRLRPDLVFTQGPKQVFATTLMSKQLGKGPSIYVTPLIPDMDIFCNRGAKDVIPLYRDPKGSIPNVTNGFLSKLEEAYSVAINPSDLFSYCSAILGTPLYAKLFEQELTTPGPRIPIPDSKEMFLQGVALGSKLIWLHTFGERWFGLLPSPIFPAPGQAQIATPVSELEENYPVQFNYDEILQKLTIGDGVICNVSPEVYNYSQSGFKVLESWIRYRMKERGGRARRGSTRSELDEIRPDKWSFTNELLETIWALEGCIALWPELDDFLNSVTCNGLLLAEDLPSPADSEKEPPVPVQDNGLEPFVT